MGQNPPVEPESPRIHFPTAHKLDPSVSVSLEALLSPTGGKKQPHGSATLDGIRSTRRLTSKLYFMEVLAAAAQQEHLREGASPGRSQGSTEHQSGRSRRKQTRSEARQGSRSPGQGASAPASGGGGGGARTKTAVAAEVAEAHAERIAAEPEAALAAWTAEVHSQVSAADAAFVAARTAHAQADAARAAARDAFRSDQRSDIKSAEWHARVAAAQQASLDIGKQGGCCPASLHTCRRRHLPACPQASMRFPSRSCAGSRGAA